MKRAITEHDLETLVRDGKVVVDRDMVMTPSAREHALRKGIQIVYTTERTTSESPASAAELAKIIEDLVVKEILQSRGGPAKPAAPAAAPASAPAAPAPAAQPAPAATPASKIDRHVLNDALASMHDSDPMPNRAVVTVVGRNRPGVVASISTAVASCGGDLADMTQTIVGDYFSLIFVVDLQGVAAKGISFRVFKEKLLEEEARLGCVKTLVMHEGIFSAMHKV